MAGSIRYFVDFAGSDTLSQIFIGITDASGIESYYGYAPEAGRSALGQGKVFTGLTPPPNASANAVAGYMDQVGWASPRYALNDQQLASVQANIDAWKANPGEYVVVGHNCVNFVVSTLQSGNVDFPTSGILATFGVFVTPHQLVPSDQQGPFFSDSNGSLAPASLHPEDFPGTPAYDYLNSGGQTFAPPRPAISVQDGENSNGTYTFNAVFEDGSSESIFETANNLFVAKEADPNGNLIRTVEIGLNAQNEPTVTSDFEGSSNDGSLVVSGQNDTGTEKATFDGYFDAGTLLSHAFTGGGYLDEGDSWADQVNAMLHSFGIYRTSYGGVIYHPSYPVARGPTAPPLEDRIHSPKDGLSLASGDDIAQRRTNGVSATDLRLFVTAEALSRATEAIQLQNSMWPDSSSYIGHDPVPRAINWGEVNRLLDDHLWSDSGGALGESFQGGPASGIVAGLLSGDGDALKHSSTSARPTLDKLHAL